MDQTVAFLSVFAVEEEGIFRISSGGIEKQTLRKLYDEGHPIDLESFSLHCVAGVLKEYVREMPEPLIPTQFYQKFIDCWEGDEVGGSGGESEEGGQESSVPVEVLRELVSLLPEEHRKVLKTLLAMLHKVSTYSAVNMMIPQNLAIVFGPNILRSGKNDLMKVMSDSSAVVGVTTAMIVVHDKLFSE